LEEHAASIYRVERVVVVNAKVIRVRMWFE
jgi:hypothetical protein